MVIRQKADILGGRTCDSNSSEIKPFLRRKCRRSNISYNVVIALLKKQKRQIHFVVAPDVDRLIAFDSHPVSASLLNERRIFMLE